MKQVHPYKTVFWIVLDGLGIGAAPDAELFGDSGSHTLLHLIEAFEKAKGRPIQLPALDGMGLGKLIGRSIAGTEDSQQRGVSFRAHEVSKGKDTTSGHWEMAGVAAEKAFPTFPEGFPEALVKRWTQENNLPGVLGNCVASGTTILEQLGEEHIRTGKPILYTSADSVWQVAAHETHFGLDRLYSICESARRLCDEIPLGRVIARPFVGESSSTFKRTYNRKDYSLPPPHRTVLDVLKDRGTSVLGVGKISNIYADQGISDTIHTEGNADGIERLTRLVSDSSTQGLVLCNLVDFDMLYGHRRDPIGYAEALEAFDIALKTWRTHLSEDTLLVLTADHGNDPTAHGTDHTREDVPVLFDSKRFQDLTLLPDADSFGDLGQTVLEALTCSQDFKETEHWHGRSRLMEFPQ